MRNKFCYNWFKGIRCLDYLGKCIVFIQMDQFIGREDLVIEEICQDFLSDLELIYIGQIIIDGDSVVY